MDEEPYSLAPPPRRIEPVAPPLAELGGGFGSPGEAVDIGLPVARGRKRARSAWQSMPLVESVFVWICDERWWRWLGGGANSRPRGHRSLPPPLPNVAASIGKPVLPPPIIQSDESDFLPLVLWRRFLANVRQRGKYHLISIVGHALAIIIIGLLAGSFHAAMRDDRPVFDATMETAFPPNKVVQFKLGDAPLDPTVLDTAALEQTEPEPIGQIEQINDDSAIFEEKGGGKVAEAEKNFGGMGGFDVKSIGAGPAVAGPGGVGAGVGTGELAGSGGAGVGFGGRGSGMREAMAGAFGGTRQTERAVAAALNWLARHQNPDGSWSLDDFAHRCKDKSCTGEGEIKSNSAATALALLPFLAAGQTHQSKGPYQKTIRSGITWLVTHQESDGDLAGDSEFSMMYTHGLATITVCEAFALTGDSRVGAAAQHAVKFIEAAQNTAGGGWRYSPGQPGDTSVTGWQVMALKSAQMAGLKVDPETFKGAKKFLLSVSSGSAGNEFSYLKGDDPSPTMCAVGLLCSQYLGAQRGDAIMQKGVGYLNRNKPSAEERDCYYWYYATQVMHNVPGKDWDAWNRQMRRVLVKSQAKEGCAMGSWDPDKPSPDIWGRRGGRLMQTSLSCLTLEVYYRYLPLYRLDGSAAPDQPAAEQAEGGSPSASATPEQRS